MTKRCILFVVDALTEHIAREWIEAGKLPTLRRMLEEGGSLSPCTSIFPSITPAATSSIVTGEYPRRHGIEGACWLEKIENDVGYFGDDLKMVYREGFHEYLVDFGDKLNAERLREPTIYEHLHSADIDSASINFMWFRGPHVHKRTTPITVKLAAGELDSEVRGPKYLKLGDFVHDLPASVPDVQGMKTGLMGRYGFHDRTTAECLLAMARADAMPTFTLGYFPLNDDRAHKGGLRSAAASCLEVFDKFLEEFVALLGGWDAIGQHYSLLIVGDHGQIPPTGDEMNVVALDELLEQYQLADTMSGFAEGDELLICPNMRAGAIYVADGSDVLRDRVIDDLLDENAIDQIIYEENRSDHKHVMTVRTRDRGRLSFSRAAGDAACVVSDQYANRWEINGELTAVDLRINEAGTLLEGDYPNVLERIEGSFTGGPSPIWVTAKPGSEMVIQEVSSHEGGSHGSLHRGDSIAGLFVSSDIQLGGTMPRITDVMDLCLKSLEVERIDCDTSAMQCTPT